MLARLVPFLVVLLLPVRPAMAQSLIPGSPAPAIQVAEFIKGQPVKAFARGKTYVVEFWATWCAACAQTIPHLTELQRKYKDVTFIGVSILEEDPSKVRPYVRAMGDRMNYRVATDQVPGGLLPEQGKMVRAWMDAAGRTTLPSAFIVNAEGKVAWIGRPLDLDDVLPAVVSGKYDLAAAAADARRQAARQEALLALQKRIDAAQREGGPQRVVEAIDEVVSKSPELEANTGVVKLKLLLGPLSQPVGGIEYARRLVATVYAKEPLALTMVALMLCDQPGREPSPEAAKVALTAAALATKLTGQKDPGCLDALARATFVSGDAKAAVEIQTRALDQVRSVSTEAVPDFQRRLDEYLAAAGK